MNQAVRYSLSELRERATFEVSRMLINRATARMFNFFEENRISSKAFIEVQKASSMDLYVSSWSKLIRFFLGLLANPDACFTLIERYLNSQPKIEHFFCELTLLAEALYAVNKSDLNLVKCLNLPEIETESDFNDTNNTLIQFLRLHALNFIQAVDSLFITFVRYYWQNFSFNSSVVGFAALHTLNEQDAWISAQNLSSRFSGWIHCMQLWLLFYCLRKKQSFNFENEKLQNIVRREC